MKGFEGEGHKVVINQRYDPLVQRHNLARTKATMAECTVLYSFHAYTWETLGVPGGPTTQRENTWRTGTSTWEGEAISGWRASSIQSIHQRGPIVNSGAPAGSIDQQTTKRKQIPLLRVKSACSLSKTERKLYHLRATHDSDAGKCGVAPETLGRLLPHAPGSGNGTAASATLGHPEQGMPLSVPVSPQRRAQSRYQPPGTVSEMSRWEGEGCRVQC